MLRALAQALASFVAIFEWRTKNAAVKQAIDLNEALHQAKVEVYNLSAAALADPTLLELARLRLHSLEQQADILSRAAASYTATSLPPDTGTTDKK